MCTSCRIVLYQGQVGHLDAILLSSYGACHILNLLSMFPYYQVSNSPPSRSLTTDPGGYVNTGRDSVLAESSSD